MYDVLSPTTSFNCMFIASVNPERGSRKGVIGPFTFKVEPNRQPSDVPEISQ